MKLKKIILCFVPHYLPGFRSGGVARSIANFVDQLGDEFDIRIICSDRDLNDSKSYSNIKIDSWNVVGKAKVFYASKKTISFFGIKDFLSQAEYDVIYFNSFFSFRFTILPLFVRIFGSLKKKTFVISTRGEFSEGALQIKKIKKIFFIFIVKYLGLYKNLNWQASSILELEDIKKNFGEVAQKINIVPDLISTKVFSYKKKNKRDSKNLKIIFLSRISPMKNLVFLIRVLTRVSIPLKLSIYGHKEDANYWNYCKKIIKKLPSNIKTYIGKEIHHEKIFQYFQKNDLFAFPTRGENFGHVVLESLSVGTCVILSDKTPWRSKHPAIEAIPLDEDAWVLAIEEWSNLRKQDFINRRNLALKYFYKIKIENKTYLKLNKKLFYDI
jgi:glycosyltransferase involved in cell wall biosynthesis